MTHEEAVAILKGPRESGADGYRKYTQACTEVYIKQMQRKGRGEVFTQDAPRKRPSQMNDREFDSLLGRLFGKRKDKMRTRDFNEEAREQLAKPNITAGGSNPEGGVGGELLVKLPGRIGSYYISALEDGNEEGCGLYQHSSAEDPSVVGQDPAMTAARDAAMRKAGATDQMIALRQRDDGQREVLRRMNAANKARWS